MKIQSMLSTVFLVLTLSGCVPLLPPQKASMSSPEQTPERSAKKSNAVPVGRYRSVSLNATPAQSAPLLAVSQFTFNPEVRTVGQAVSQVLAGSGFALVPAPKLTVAAREVLKKALPVTQRKLGPISVRDALTTLMGDGVFRVVVDPVHRLVTFRLAPQFSKSSWE